MRESARLAWRHSVGNAETCFIPRFSEDTMALKLTVDTCVWLDLAKNYRQEPVISALEDLIKARERD